MKISQPKTARVINTARVLSLIRNNSTLSKAEIARLLNLNKVSTGEIVDALIEQGLVRESGKIEVSNGRRPTSLELVADAKYVLAIDIGRKNITTALCNLVGKPVKIERVPSETDKTAEEFCVAILKSAVRTIKLVSEEKLLGIGITIEGKVASDNHTIQSSFLPWKNIDLGKAFETTLNIKTVVVNSLEALVSAEKTIDSTLRDEEKLLYLDWGHSIALAIVNSGKVVNASQSFGHMKVAQAGLCTCGQIGCLEAWCSSYNITHNAEARLGDAWESVSDEVYSYIAKALKTASEVTGIEKVVIGGEASTITEKALKTIRSKCQNLEIAKSQLGDRAEILAAAESALDTFFFLSSALDGMKDYI